MAKERLLSLWFVSILVAPFLYSVLTLLLAFAAAAGLQRVAPGFPAATLWPSTFAKTVVALLALWLIHRYRLGRLAGLSRQDKWEHRLWVLIPLYLPLGMLYGTGFHVPNDPPAVFAAIAECVLTGFSEEVFFRGFLLSVLVKRLWEKRGGIAVSVLLSSATFGMMHWSNCLKKIDVGPGFHIGFDATTQSTVSALVQMVYATFIGVFFAAVLLKSNKLWPLVLMHALVNFPAALRTMAKRAATEPDGGGQAGVETIVIDLNAIVWTAPLLIVGLLLLRTVKPADIARKLGGAASGASLSNGEPTGSAGETVEV